MTALLLTLVFTLCSHSFARGDRDMSILDKLDLSNEQISKIAIFKSEQRKKRASMKEVMKEHRKKMKELFVTGAPDSELRKLHESIQSDRGSRSDKKLEKMIFLKNLLTKEQREAYIEKQKDHRKMKKNRRKRK